MKTGETIAGILGIIFILAFIYAIIFIPYWYARRQIENSQNVNIGQ